MQAVGRGASLVALDLAGRLEGSGLELLSRYSNLQHVGMTP